MNRMKHGAARAGCVLVALLLALAGASPAGGLEQEELKVSRTNTKAKGEFGPIVASNAQVLSRKPSECKVHAYCDVVPVRIDSSAFASNDTFQVDFTLTWLDGTACDLDMYIYDSKEVRIGRAASSAMPEKTSLDRPPTALYYVTVNNFAGANDGYTIDLEMKYTGKLKAIPKFTRATPRPPLFTPLPEVSAEPVVKPKRPAQSLEAAATLAPVLTPGPDGTLTSVALEAVRGSSARDGGMSWWMVLMLIVAVGGIAGGSGYFAFRRVRARRAG